MDKRTKIKKIRITNKSLTTMVQDLADRLELPFTISCCTATRFTPDQYEGGACKQWIRAKYQKSHEFSMLCFYSKKELEDHINNGFKLKINPPDSRRGSNEWELDITRK